MPSFTEGDRVAVSRGSLVHSKYKGKKGTVVGTVADWPKLVFVLVEMDFDKTSQVAFFGDELMHIQTEEEL